MSGDGGLRREIEALRTHTRRNGWASPRFWVDRREVLATPPAAALSSPETTPAGVLQKDDEPKTCGCGHGESSHFPACLAEVEDKPRQEFASPFKTGRWEPRYICGCPNFGSPAGASLGKRRAKNSAARLAVEPSR